MNTDHRGRRRRSIIAPAAVAIVAAAALAACGSSSSSSSSSSAAAAGSSAGSSSGSSGGFTLNVGYIGNVGLMTGPEGFAYSKGLLQKWLAPAGVSSIKLAQFANGPLLTAAMTGGSVDLGILGDTPALIAKSHGLPAKLINQNEVGLPAWIVAKKGGATTLAALSGKTIARPAGSYMDRYLQGALAQQGLTSKVHLTEMLPPQAIPAAENGSIDAVALPAWEVAPIIKAGGVAVAKSETTPSIQGTEVTIATNKVLGSHANLATVWNAARKKAVAYANAHQAAFYAYDAKSNGITAGASAAKSFLPLSLFKTPDYTPTGLKLLQGTLNFLVSEKEASSFSIDGWKQSGT